MSLPITAEQARTLFTLALAAFASQASIRLCDPMLPQLGADFGLAAATDAVGVVTAFTVAYGLFQLFYGPLGDRYGKLLVVTCATVAAALGSLACALAPGLHALTVLRFLTGAACAGLIPMALAWIGDNVDYAHRQRTLARFLTGSTSGIIFGQVAGGIFADTLGWRACFGVLAAVLAGVSVLLWRRLRALRAVAASAQASTTSAPPPPARLSLTSAARQFAEVLRIGWARVLLALVFAEGAMVFGATAFIPTHLHVNHGLSLLQGGLAVAGFGAGGLTYALGSWWLIPRLGERGLVAAGGACFFVGVVAMGSPWLPLEMLKCYAAGAGFFMLHNTLQTLATQMAPQSRGTAISTFAFGLFAGQSGGVALAAALLPRMGYTALFAGSATLMVVLSAIVFAMLTARQRAGAISRP